MPGRQFRIATVYGIPVRIDASWLLIAALVTASMAYAFSNDYPRIRLLTSFALGLSATLLLFGSVLAHELAHAVVALRAGIAIRGITLFIFGGAAEMAEEPKRAVDEFKIAIAGPAMSIVLALGFLVGALASATALPEPAGGLMRYLALMNGILVAFNIIPGFPLDGGRVLRAILWGLWGSYSAATRVASGVGGLFGATIVALGLFYVLRFNNLFGGIWFVFIGMFLRGSARAGYHHMLLRGWFEGVRASDIMSANMVVVRPEVSVEELVHAYPLPFGITEWLVVDDGALRGSVRQHDVARHPAAEWQQRTSEEVMRTDVLSVALDANDDASKAVVFLLREDRLVPVLEQGALSGVINRRMLQRHMEAQEELRTAGLA